nr:hypothetical protein [uncultured Flavobacterium sp.]
MKKLTYLIAFFTLISCKQSLVQFAEAQPENTKNIENFPKKLRGDYYDLENDVNLTINENSIIKQITIKDTININELSENEVLKNDTIFNLKNSNKFSVTKVNDSLLTNYIIVDTLFFISNENVLKKKKGYYFLNTKYSANDTWEVKKMVLKNGQLNINGITSEDEIKLLEKITETTKDSISPFVVKPTKKQFNTFVKQNGFTTGQNYLKSKNGN